MECMAKAGELCCTYKHGWCISGHFTFKRRIGKLFFLSRMRVKCVKNSTLVVGNIG